MIVFILKVFLFVILGAVLVAVVLIIKSRREGTRQYEKYARYTKEVLAQSFDLKPCYVRDEFQLLKPWKAFGMFVNIADLKTGGKFRRVNAFESTLGFFMKMFTILFFPDYQYNVPIMSVDIIFMGGRRVFVIEIIDTAKIEDENIRAHYAQMRSLRPKVAPLRQKPVTRWYKDIVTDFSIHAQEDRSKDDVLFEIYQEYLAAYLDMVRAAQPLNEELRATVQKSVKEYVDNLISQGGPAVDLLVKLMGVEKQKEYVYTVMFGL
jgi:hypothetical protein